jgi:hypothetical protein
VNETYSTLQHQERHSWSCYETISENWWIWNQTCKTIEEIENRNQLVCFYTTGKIMNSRRPPGPKHVHSSSFSNQEYVISNTRWIISMNKRKCQVLWSVNTLVQLPDWLFVSGAVLELGRSPEDWRLLFKQFPIKFFSSAFSLNSDIASSTC